MRAQLVEWDGAFHHDLNHLVTGRVGVHCERRPGGMHFAGEVLGDHELARFAFRLLALVSLFVFHVEGRGDVLVRLRLGFDVDGFAADDAEELCPVA